MKIRTCAALLIAMLALSLLAGCASSTIKALDAAEDAVEQQLDAAEDVVEAVIVQAVLPESTTPPPAEISPPVPAETAPPAPAETTPPETTAPPAPSVPAVTEAAKQLTAEDAKAVALQHAGFTSGQVKYLRAEYDIDDRIPQYDVEFHEGRWEYEYEIHAETGVILSFEKDD